MSDPFSNPYTRELLGESDQRKPGIQGTTRSEPAPRLHLSLQAQKTIGQVEACIDDTEEPALANLNASPDHAHRVALLGKLLLFDKTLSLNRNEACTFCHMPEVGFGAPVSRST